VELKIFMTRFDHIIRVILGCVSTSLSKNEFPIQRKDIQGLRGIAVLSVVLYHANLLVHGGFVGVDIFFVISGYVILKSLLREHLLTGTMNVRDFINRRIRRLLPALSVLSVSTLIASIFILSPLGDQQQAARSAQAASLFGANIYLALENSYFALINNPFRHTWTLAVEEQFYLCLIFAIASLRWISEKKSINFTKLLFALFASATVFSFVISTIFSYGFRFIPLPTRFAFFSMPTRAWEFLAGALIALTEIYRPKRSTRIGRSNLYSALGIALISYALFKFNTFTNYPGIAAMLPVIGSMLLIMNTNSKNFFNRVLSCKPLVWCGDVSYSWYLWHWPMIVFTTILWPGSKTAVLIGALGSLVPAIASYYFLEARFRVGHTSDGWTLGTFRIALLSIAAPIFVSVLTLIGASTGYGLERNISRGLSDALASRYKCEMEELPFPISSCLFTAEPGRPLVLLLGDSQAGTNSDPLYAATRALNLNFAVWFNNGCPIFPRPTVERLDCEEYLTALPELITSLNPAVIVIANTSTLYTTAGAQRGGLTITKENGEPPSTYQDAIDTWIRGLSVTLSRTELLNRGVMIVGQVPPSPFISPSILRPKVSTESFALLSAADRNLIVQKENDVIKQHTNAVLFDTSEVLCPADKCIYSTNGKDVYSDSIHLTVEGSMLLREGYIQLLQQFTR